MRLLPSRQNIFLWNKFPFTGDKKLAYFSMFCKNIKIHGKRRPPNMGQGAMPLAVLLVSFLACKKSTSNPLVLWGKK